VKVDGRFARTFASFSSYNFRLFWWGQLVSQIGTWMQMVALPWLVLEKTGSAVALGTVTALQYVPIPILVLFAGIAVDRFPKQRLLLVTQTLFLVQALALALLTATDRVQLWQLYVLALILGIGNAFDSPARQAFVTELVGRDQVVNAVGLSSAQFSSARLVGPALGGLIIAALGPAACFFLNTASFLAVLISLLLLRPGEFHSLPGARTPGPVFGQLRDGIRFLFSTPELTTATIVLAGNGAFIYSTSSIIPLIARNELGVGPEQFGLLIAAVGLGSLFMALTIAGRGRSSERILLWAATAFGVFYLSLAFAPSFAAGFVLLAIVGGSIQVFGTSVNSLMQIRSPDHLRGRVMAVFTLLTNGITPLGALFTGFVTAAAGIRVTLAGEAAICLIFLAAALAYRLRAQARLALQTAS
jgi:MFS family permease